MIFAMALLGLGLYVAFRTGRSAQRGHEAGDLRRPDGRSVHLDLGVMMEPLEYLGDGQMLLQMKYGFRLFPSAVGGQVVVDVPIYQALIYRVVDVHEDLVILGPL